MLEQTTQVSSGEEKSSNIQAPDIQREALRGSPALPVTPSSPVPEHVKKMEFEMDPEGELEYEKNSDAATEGEGLVKEKKKPEAKVAAKVEEETAKEEEEVKPVEKPKFSAKLPSKPVVKEQEETETKPGEKKVEPRDYSVFPEEVREHIKNTSNPAFNFLKDTYKRLQEVEVELNKIKPEYESIQKTGLPSSWVEHPDAWRLHPEVQQAFGRISKIEFEENHWKEQLIAIKAGKPYKIIQGYQNGQPMLSGPIEPSEEAAEAAIANHVKLQGLKQNVYTGINTFAQGFKNRVEEQSKAVEKIIEEEWPWYKDEKHPAQKHVKLFEESIPSDVPAHMMRKTAALLYASYQAACELLAEKKEVSKTQQIVQETRKAVEPRTSAPAGGVNKPIGPKGRQIPAAFDVEELMK